MIFKRLKKSDFTRSVVILITGSVLSQAIPFITLPILQKFFFSPADFGLLAVFMSFCELFSNISCLKTEYGIVLQHKSKDAINSLIGSISIAVVFSILVFIAVIIFPSQLASKIGEIKIKPFLILVPLYVLSVGISEAFSYWFNRQKQFGKIAQSKVAQTLSAETFKLTSGIIKQGSGGLLMGRTLGFSVAACFYFFKFWKIDSNYLRLVNIKQIKQMLLKNKSYIIFTTPSILLSSLVNMTFIWLFLKHFGKEIVGLLGVSMSYISAGLGVISMSFGQVFYNKISENTSTNSLKKLYIRYALLLSLVSMCVLFVIYLIPTDLVILLLGDKWKNLMPVARVMALWQSVAFVSSSLSFIYLKLGRQKEMLIIDLVHLLLITAGFYVGFYYKHNFNSALWGYTIAQIVYYIFLVYIAIYFINKSNTLKEIAE